MRPGQYEVAHIDDLTRACLSHHLLAVQGVASRAGSTKFKYYLEEVCGGVCPGSSRLSPPRELTGGYWYCY